MKIEFESTIDEAVDVQLRLMELSKVASRMKWEGLLFTPIIFLGLYFGIPDKTVNFIYAIMAGIIFTLMYLVMYDGSLRRRAKKIVIESLGTDKPVLCEYEFIDDGLIFRRQGTELKFQWESVKEVNEDDKVLEFIIESGGIAMTPKRIFLREQQKDEWLNYAKEKARTV